MESGPEKRLNADLDEIIDTEVLVSLTQRLESRNALLVLRILSGDDVLRFKILNPGCSITIGRDETSDLTVNDSSVSRRHAVVKYLDDGGISLLDLGSTNGTKLNGRKIEHISVHPGDRIDVGNAALRLDWFDNTELVHLEEARTQLDTLRKDPLTGLLMRSFVMEELEDLAENWEKGNIPCSCVFIDLDFFKKINDDLGHDQGDIILKGVSKLMLKNLPSFDICVRYGGEEFLIIMPGANEEIAVDVAEKLHKDMRSANWEGFRGSQEITASMGIAQKLEEESIEAWINRADIAMYEAKRRGRARIIAASKLDTDR